MCLCVCGWIGYVYECMCVYGCVCVFMVCVVCVVSDRVCVPRDRSSVIVVSRNPSVRVCVSS